MGFKNRAVSSPFLMGGILPGVGDVHTGDKFKVVMVQDMKAFGDVQCAGAFVTTVDGKPLPKPLKLTGTSCSFLAERGFDEYAGLIGKTLTVEVKPASNGKPTITVVAVE